MTDRKYFGTDGIRGRVGDSVVSPEFILRLGWAFGRVIADEGGSKVLIGKDTRISGYLFESALEAGLSSAGIDIHLLGPMPTPALAYLTRTLRAQAGIMISASHNPYYDNGIKFFSSEGTKLPDAMELAIEKNLEMPMKVVDSINLGKAVRVDDARGRYIEFCKASVSSRFTLKGMKIIVDCANGATYYVAPHIFSELGAEVVELSVEPDGLNINDNCGSTRPETLQKVVLAEQADLGIAFDGDGDRVIMVDKNGEIVDGDELLFIMAQIGVETKRVQSGVVGTVMSNLGLEIAVRNLGLDFVRTKVGDRYVLEELQNKGWHLGGESSGHIIWLKATTTGDGIIAALQVLAAIYHSGRPLHVLKKNMQKFPHILLNVRVKNHLEQLKNPSVVAAIQHAELQLNGRGRVLLRPSGTEPVVRVMVEGEDNTQVHQLAYELAEVVEKNGVK